MWDNIVHVCFGWYIDWLWVNEKTEVFQLYSLQEQVYKQVKWSYLDQRMGGNLNPHKEYMGYGHEICLAMGRKRPLLTDIAQGS